MSSNFQTDLRNLVQQASPGNRAQVQQDIDKLLEAGLTSYHELIEVINDPNAADDIPVIACWVLGKVRYEPALPSLISNLKNSNPVIRREIADALNKFRTEQVVEPLISLLSDNASEVRKAAAYSLGIVASTQAIEPLTKIAEDKNEIAEVRGMAIEALANIGERRVVPSLIDLLRDPSTEVQFWAAYALGDLKDERAIPELERLTQKEELKSPETDSVRQEALSAIELIKSGNK